MSTKDEFEAERRAMHESLNRKFFSPDPAERQQAIDAVTDYCRLRAREEGLQLPVHMIAGVIPVYENDFATPKGQPWPDVRKRLAQRVLASPFAIPDEYAREFEKVAAVRAPEVAELLRELIDKATAAVLATQDRRIASILAEGTHTSLKAKLEQLLASIPWGPQPAAVDGVPPA